MFRCLKLSVFPTVLIFILGLLFSFAANPEKATKPASAPAKAQVGLLDGGKYTGNINVKGDKKSGMESVIFDKEKVISTTFLPYGFNTTAYSAEKQKDGSITFKSELTSSKPENGKLRLEGTVKGNSLTGSAVWTKKDGKKTEYEIKAEKK